MATRMKQRRGTAAEWASLNPVLEAGEIGFETDTQIIKLGDGITAWNDLSLPYLPSAGGITTGPITLVQPTQPDHAARKVDVDTVNSAVSAMPKGEIAYITRTSSFISSPDHEVYQEAMSQEVTLLSGRNYEAFFWASFVISGSSSVRSAVDIDIFDVIDNHSRGRSIIDTISGPSRNPAICIAPLRGIPSGPRTLKVRVKRLEGPSSVGFNATSTLPAFFRVSDMGPA